MFIKSIHLNCFKSYENVKINFNEKFSVLIGENNIGKTTVFEAIQLWYKCFDKSITSNGKDFYSQSTNLYISFDELYFLRLIKDTDIFYSNKRSCEIILSFSIDERPFTLGFRLTRPQIANAYIRICQIDSDEFESFKDYLTYKSIKLHEFLFIQQTAPVANVLSKEPYMFDGQIIKKIQKGKSNEVLRNKILKCLETDTQLTNWMSSVLDKEFEFIIPKRTSKNKEEYINLLVKFSDSQKQEIYLQGSGFLQTAEIFSTIKIAENSLNIMLIDEPDSHISPRIQNKLLQKIKEIPNTQIIIISHNDNFIESLHPENIVFINEENKESGNIQALDEMDIDHLHLSLGGIISGLTRLQRNKKVLFMEGEDDIEYIKQLNQAIKRIDSGQEIDLSKVSFYFLRGKDYIPNKLSTGRQLLSQAVKNCDYAVIFDKDYSTLEANEEYKRNVIKRRLGSNHIFTHNGYCIESVLFSDKEKLSRFIKKLVPENFDTENFIESYFQEISDNISQTSSTLYRDMKEKFKCQKKEARPELNGVDFDEFSSESKENIHYAMNKDNIKNFVLSLEELLGHNLFERQDDSSESFSSNLLSKYFETIHTTEDFFQNHIELIEFLQDFINN